MENASKKQKIDNSSTPFFNKYLIAYLPHTITIKQQQIFEKSVSKFGGRFFTHHELNKFLEEDGIDKYRGYKIVILIKRSQKLQSTNYFSKEIYNQNNIEFVDLEWLQKSLGRRQVEPTDTFRLVRNLMYHFITKIPNSLLPRLDPYRKHAPHMLNHQEFSQIFQQIQTEAMKTLAAILNNIVFHIIIEKLEEMEQFYENKGDMSRQIAYRRTIAVLKACTRKIKNGQELKKIQYIGPKMIEKINEIIQQGQLNIQHLCQSQEAKVLERFLKIYGVGLSTANAWFQLGYKDIDEIQSANEKGILKPSLSPLQLIGIKYFSDIEEPITLEDKNLIITCIESALNDMSLQINFQVAGGFRRGKTSGHDLDLLFSIPVSFKGQEGELLQKMVSFLHPKHIEVILSKNFTNRATEYHKKPSTVFGDGHPKVLCLFNIGHQRPLRRVDLIFVPERQWGFAFLGWSGSKHFEQSIRQYSKDKRQWILSNHGFTDASTNELVPIECETEEQVFLALGLDFRLPNERCC